ncbi:MAG: hypothetical protein MMC33_008472 [Icmadophila ericetorum]|nr:hypothetical protein [Icmadophila ericetorum]
MVANHCLGQTNLHTKTNLGRLHVDVNYFQEASNAFTSNIADGSSGESAWLHEELGRHEAEASTYLSRTEMPPRARQETADENANTKGLVGLDSEETLSDSPLPVSPSSDL